MFKNFFNFIKERLTALVYSLASSDLARFLLSGTFERLENTWSKTNDDVDVFIQNHKDILSKIEFSHSFSPEQMEWVSTMEEFKDKNKVSSVDGLKVFAEKFGIKNVRLGIRWSDVDKDGKIDLSRYKDLINYSLQNNFSICLNIGPIKTFRWPEVYIPESLIKENNSQFNIIDIDSEISKASLDYLKRLFQKLEQEFGKEFFGKVEVVQPENEMFNPFGPKEWIVSEEHVIEISKLVKTFFQKSKILISVSGGPNGKDFFIPDIIKAQGLVRKMQKTLATKNIVIGFNYYYKMPGMPVNKNGIMLDNFSFLKILNGKDIFKNAFAFSQEFQNELEISELQFEHWGEIVTPGTSLREFQFSLLRVLEELNIQNYSHKFIVRLWGSELFTARIAANSLTSDQEKIIETIHKIQTL